MINTIANALATGIMGMDLFIITLFLLFILKITINSKLLDKATRLYSPYAWTLAFLTALASMLGSLFFSEIAKLQPCVLCWYQRIFMYPLPLLLYISLIRRETSIKPHVIALSAVGALIASYHYFLQLFPNAHIVPCEAFSPVSCTEGYTFYYGYISIPMMSLSAFLMIIVLLLSSSKNKHA